MTKFFVHHSLYIHIKKYIFCMKSFGLILLFLHIMDTYLNCACLHFDKFLVEPYFSMPFLGAMDDMVLNYCYYYCIRYWHHCHTIDLHYHNDNFRPSSIVIDH